MSKVIKAWVVYGSHNPIEPKHLHYFNIEDEEHADWCRAKWQKESASKEVYTKLIAEIRIKQASKKDSV